VRRLRILNVAAVVAVGVASWATAACGSTATSSSHRGSPTPCASAQGEHSCATANTPTASTPSASANAAAQLFLSLFIPEPSAGSGTYFYGVTCVSATECWATGTTQLLTQALIEGFDGTSWKIAVKDTSATYFYGSACVSADDCWAVGTATTTSAPVPKPIILHFTGQAWTPMASPAVSDGGFFSVSCPSSTECWAAGDQTTGSTQNPLLEIYSDGVWTIASAPSQPGNAGLEGIACPASDDCWAVGIPGDSGPALIEHYDGTSWTTAASPSISSLQNSSDAQGELKSVTCLAPSDCWAVGDVTSHGATVSQFLAEHWDGSAWAVVPAPMPAGQGQLASLDSVSCASATDCWAVGGQVIEQYTGSSWALINAPWFNKGSALAVTCLSSGDCWAVGSSRTAGPFAATNGPT